MQENISEQNHQKPIDWFSMFAAPFGAGRLEL
jgi:hypothetical protein